MPSAHTLPSHSHCGLMVGTTLQHGRRAAPSNTKGTISITHAPMQRGSRTSPSGSLFSCACMPSAAAGAAAQTTASTMAPSYLPATTPLPSCAVSSIVPSTFTAKHSAYPSSALLTIIPACTTDAPHRKQPNLDSPSPSSPASLESTTSPPPAAAAAATEPAAEPALSAAAAAMPAEAGDLPCLNRAPGEAPLCNVPHNFLEHYELQTLIGAGEYGRVWRALRLSDGTLHAVKVMPKQRPDRSMQENLRRIECEISIWRQCQASPYVCKLEEVFQDDDSVYVVQELCAGGDLRSLVAEGPVSEQQAAHIMRAVLDVVYICHTNSCTFGDVKPANFLLKEPLQRNTPTSLHSGPFASTATTATMASMGTMDTDTVPHSQPHFSTPSHHDSSNGNHHSNGIGSGSGHSSGKEGEHANGHCGHGRGEGAGESMGSVGDAADGSAAAHAVPIVRATDFGFSYRCNNVQESHQHIGSPVYMAPELWGVGQECGPASDVWAAGVMMYQLLSARYPFWDTPASSVDRLPLYQVMLAVTSNPIHMNGPEWDCVSRQAKDLVMAMLDRDSTTRITVDQALAHPWFRRMLGFTPQPSTLRLDAACRNN